MSTNSQKLTKNERRAQAREQARIAREAQRRKEARNRRLVVIGAALAAVALVAAIVAVIVSNIRDPQPGPANMASGGIVVGEGLKAVRTEAMAPGAGPVATEQDPTKLNIVVYQDYFCPACGVFERANADAIRTLVESGQATVEYHNLAFEDHVSLGTQYSTRSANAGGCIAEHAPDSYFAWNELMFENQPEQLTRGLTNEQMLEFAEQAGADVTEELRTCVMRGTFHDWVADSTERLLDHPSIYTTPEGEPIEIRHTPTVIVNGHEYQGQPGDAAAFQSFLQARQGEIEAQKGADGK